MNYYIQGNKERADEIKAAFEKLGYDISWPEGFANPDVINIGVERNGAKYVIAETSEYIKDIIKTHPDYTELELPVEPKFKVEDWIISEHPDAIFKVGDVKKTTYQLIDIYGDSYDCQITEIEKNYHLWSIADTKDGDVLATNSIICIFKKLDKDGYYIFSPCIYTIKDGLEIISDENDTIGSCSFKPATKEQRDLLFQKINDAGYQWDGDKKELRKIQPHYDIANFHAGMPVLVRIDNSYKWSYTLFSHYNEGYNCPFSVASCCSIKQCIPFEGNEHLLGTTDMCPEEYINW